MLFTLEVLKAHEGDCLLLHWGSVANPKLAVIDGGPTDTYETSLLPRLEKIRTNRKLATLELEFVMVSHVDNDHIVGVKKLFSALKSDADRNVPQANRKLRAKRLWHNTFDDIVGNAMNAHYQQFTASFTADASGSLPADSEKTIDKAFRDQGEPDDEAEHLASDVAKLLAGHGEGRDLRVIHRFLHDKNEIAGLNRPFTSQGGSTLITASLTPAPKDLGGIKLRVVGPLDAEIEALQAAFDEYLKKNRLNTAEAALAAYADKSVPNLSSIVCMVTAGTGAKKRSILLTGDARGDKIIDGLRGAKYLDGSANERLHVDVLKVQHHGSDHNAAAEFFQKVRADTYVLSGDGKHGNPERDVLKWIIESRGPTDKYRIVTTYGLAETDARRKAESRKPWDAAKHSNAALIAEKKPGNKFTLTDGAPVLIELGDEKIAW